MNLNISNSHNSEERDEYIRKSFEAMSPKEILWVLSQLKDFQTQSTKENISNDITSVLKNISASNDDIYGVLESLEARKKMRNTKDNVNKIVNFQ